MSQYLSTYAPFPVDRSNGPDHPREWWPSGGFGAEPVADAEVGVDVAPVRGDLLQLGAHAADQDVDRAVAARHLAGPHQGVDLGTPDDARSGGSTAERPPRRY